MNKIWRFTAAVLVVSALAIVVPNPTQAGIIGNDSANFSLGVIGNDSASVGVIGNDNASVGIIGNDGFALAYAVSPRLANLAVGLGLFR